MAKNKLEQTLSKKSALEEDFKINQSHTPFPKKYNFLSFFNKNTICALLIGIISMLVYTNTFKHQFAVDDAIVITRNQFTKQGLKGMKGIWTEDTFVGFFGKQQNLVSGGRYRPLSVATFALEMELFGDHPKHPQTKEYFKGPDGDFIKNAEGNYLYEIDPMYGHITNVLLYGLLCIMIYYTILQLMQAKFGITQENTAEKGALAGFIAFATAILYATHPIHTEAIANIKGRDEILVMMGSIMALHYTVKVVLGKGSSALNWFLAILGFGIGIFSKESAIPFLAVIPAAIYIFVPNSTLKQALKYTAPFFAITLVFWFALRGPILEIKDPNDPMNKVLAELSENMYKNHKSAFFWIKNEPTELMNNPFLKLQNGRYMPFNDSERLGTIVYTWKEYLRLLAFPYTLTNDYYPYHISIPGDEIKGSLPTNFIIPTMKHPQALLSLLFHIALGIYGLVLCKRRKVLGFCILFYFATFSVVSNFFFPIGTNMAERFMFMPSFAFSFACAMALAALIEKEKYAKFALPILGLVTVLYSAKTIHRNLAWENDYVLFTTDIHNSPHSAKLNNAVSGVIQDYIVNNPNISPEERLAKLKDALTYSTTAIKMHPTYNNAWLLYGNSNTMLGNVYRNIKDKTPIQSMMYGKYVTGTPAEITAMHFDEAIKAYNEVLRLRPDHQDAPQNLGIVYMDKGNFLINEHNNIAEALKNFQLSARYLPNDPNIHRLIGTANAFLGNLPQAKESLERSLQLQPNQSAVLYNLSIVYRNMGDIGTADSLLGEVQRIDPQYFQSLNK